MHANMRLFFIAAVLLIAACHFSTVECSFRLRRACEHKTAVLTCRKGYSVHAVSAFYGRATARLCSSGRKDRQRWRKLRRTKRICASKIALRRVRRLCDGRRRCKVTASNKIFGDPCRGVSKYLRIRYICKFSKCKKIRYYQRKMLKRFNADRRKRRHVHSKKAAKDLRRRMLREMKKINKLRRRFRSCFDCHRGCRYLHYVERRFARRERKIRKLIRKQSWSKYMLWNPTAAGRNVRSGRHVRVSRWYLRRKLWYYRRHRRLIGRHLKRCLYACFY